MLVPDQDQLNGMVAMLVPDQFNGMVTHLVSHVDGMLLLNPCAIFSLVYLVNGCLLDQRLENMYYMVDLPYF